jgi:hypothetical protein
VAFETPLFLVGLSAVAIPVILHLIFRLRKRAVRFGTLRFLRKVVEKNRKRLRLRDIILLLLRAAALVLIVLAFARPYFVDPEIPAGDERRDVVFVLDDSFSMSAGRMARTAFEEAKSHILEEISSLSSGDRAALVLATGGGRVVTPLSTDLDAVLASLRTAPITFERAELAGALRAASGLLSGSDAPIGRISVASDLQRSSWNESELAALPRSEVTYESLLPPADAPNLAVLSAAPVSEFWSPSAPVTVRARIANYGDTDAKGVAVRLRVGDEGPTRTTLTVDVPAGGEAAAELSYLSAAPGEFPATVELEGRDSLNSDDRRHLVIRLRDRLQILCVQDKLPDEKRRYEGESYFLRMALDPRLGTAEPGSSPFSTERIETRWLDSTVLRAADAASLIGTRLLTDGQISSLKEWVAAGGGVLIAPDSSMSNDTTYPTDDKLISAGLLAARTAGIREISASFYEGLPLVERAASHPIWAPFLETPPTSDMMRVKKLAMLEPLDGSTVVAAFEGGYPAVVERSLGKGRILQLAFALRPTVTDLPTRRAFVPFVHAAFGLLARSSAKADAATVEVGEPVPVAEFIGRSEQATLVAPDESRLVIGAATTDDDGAPSGAAAPIADRPGFYRLRVERLGSARICTYAANTPAAESDLRSTGPEGFLKALGTAAGSRVTKRTARTKAPERRSSTLWALLLALAVVVMLAESMLANRFLLDTRSSESVKDVRAAAAGGSQRRAAS